SVDSEKELSLSLRKFRHIRMLAICFRDLSGRADLAESLISLSDLAEAIVDGAASFLHEKMVLRHGEPLGELSGKSQKLVVLAMGKLGARELNFSSDIDLVYAYPEPGETTGPEIISNESFFTRLARKLTAVFSGNEGGLLFRLDLRLRPFGDSGPIVMSFDAMEFYYQTQGREWERYALIKCRPVSGDEKQAAELIQRLNPFVFRRYLDYGVFDSLREMKQSIVRETRKKGLEENIKTGSGGIREIEFFGQAFQLLRGGVLPGLQERGILKILDALLRFGFIEKKDRLDLRHAYFFLRYTEHRIQAWEDMQTHDLPEEGSCAFEALFCAMGFSSGKEFLLRLNFHRKEVHKHFLRLLFFEEGDRENPMQLLWEILGDDRELAGKLLKDAGYRDPEEALRMLEYFVRGLTPQTIGMEGRKKLDVLMPLLLEACAKKENSEETLIRVLELLKSIQRRSTYFSLFLEYPSALDHLLRLASASSWIMDYLARFPMLLDELLDPRTLYHPPERADLQEDIARRMEGVDPGDLETQIEVLCVFKQANFLRVAAADVTGEIPLMKISDHLTEIAETVLDLIVALSFAELSRRHGRPIAKNGEAMGPESFSIIAYGKFGGLELGYGSDLDMVFIHEDAEGFTDSEERPLSAPQFFTRLGQRILHCLQTHTRAGSLYETDLRLRPDGNSGILVMPVSAFGAYQEKSAWTWEHQALVRARPISGRESLKKDFEAIRRKVLSRKRDAKSLLRDVREMREKVYAAHPLEGKGFFDLKHGKGGIMDIEFMVQYFVLAHAFKHPELSRWTDNIRILDSIIESGIMREHEATFLRSAYLRLRAAVHRLDLDERPSRVPEENF
ncbi:bifunctional [glutamate--ammonia ligase]-adenylyl-L-tyrosine phosphorylase/[glutamate--ammonia-ligase] adenylyltransferase, partial [Desulfococcaceae bacterium OttesenSCG-928-F15]|nr:bifunctional [glutamate--ammonia ligase]-adenylyl-L-tyrosine phosphorylase/[glutamate--ammonia-ligase] adenylyltransferase [Desulfococcaceae bacterium OttesenSCG-928-F15]